MSSYADRFRDRARSSGRNMHESKGGAALIPDGKGMFRLVGAVEIGKQLKTYNNNVIVRNQIMLTWELSGKKWQPDNGRNITRTIRYTNSDSSKAELYKMFAAMDPNEEYARIGEMLDMAFLGEVFHKKASNGKTYANFRGISSAIYEDPATEEIVDLSDKAAPRTAKLMGFMWDDPTLEDWDNLYIEGQYDDGGSKNIFQQAIRAAEDFEGSPIFTLLEEDQRDPYADYPDGGDEINGSAAKNRKEIEKSNDRIRNGRGRGDGSDDGDQDEDKPAGRSSGRSGARGAARGGNAPSGRSSGRSAGRSAGRSSDTGW